MTDQNPKFVVLTDFDGTVTLTDSNDHLTDNYGMGYDARRALNHKVLDGTLHFRDAFREMLRSVASKKTIPECIEILCANIKLDPGFADFYRYCKSQNIPVVVVSSGMEPLIRALFETLLSQEEANEIPIISNSVKNPETNEWDIVYRHEESGFGHDKSRSIKPYREGKYKGATLFYCGDGVSDLSAARETDLLFAKDGQDLITYCLKENVPFKPFRDFKDIEAGVRSVVNGEKTTEQVAAEGATEAVAKKQGNPENTETTVR